jgi:hypothetical protein
VKGEVRETCNLHGGGHAGWAMERCVGSSTCSVLPCCSVLEIVLKHCPATLAQVANVRCTLREMLFWKRCVKANASMLAPYSAAFKAKLLGKLDPSMWELSVLMPPAPPTPTARLLERELKAARTCRYDHADVAQCGHWTPAMKTQLLHCSCCMFCFDGKAETAGWQVSNCIGHASIPLLQWPQGSAGGMLCVFQCRQDRQYG